MCDQFTLDLSPAQTNHFWSSVNVLDDFDACWDWQKSTKPSGYGQVMLQGTLRLTHRVAYVLAYGSIPTGLFVCHSCDNRRCCNPFHLWPGTHKDNMSDCKSKGRARGNPHAVGSSNPASRLTEAQVVAIWDECHQTSKSFNEIGRMFGVTGENVSMIIKRSTWKHLDLT